MNYLESYGVAGLISLICDTIRTRLFFPNARLVRFPIYIRGRKRISFEGAFSCGRRLRLEAFGEKNTAATLIHIGRDVRFGDDVHIGAIQSVTLGDRVLLASKIFISDHNHGSYSDSEHTDPRQAPFDRPLAGAPVVIEDDVWIGEFVVVLPGVRIGKGSIIGAMTTVTKNVPAYCIAVGSPARVIKRYNFETGVWEPA